MAVNGGLHISWPTIGVAIGVVSSIVVGAIQLGSVQTHVIINTNRLDLVEARERDHLVEIAAMKARQQINEERIRASEAAILTGRTYDEQLADRISRAEARQGK